MAKERLRTYRQAGAARPWRHGPEVAVLLAALACLALIAAAPSPLQRFAAAGAFQVPVPEVAGGRLNGSLEPCPGLAGFVENDLDRDGWGDSCDEDVDGDGLVNAGDACLFDAGAACLGAPPAVVHLVNTEVLTRQAEARVAYAGLSVFEHPDPAFPALLNGVLYAVDDQPLWDPSGELSFTLSFTAAADAPEWPAAEGTLSLVGGSLALSCPAEGAAQCTGRLRLEVLLDGLPLSGPAACAPADLRCAWSVTAALADDGLVNAWGAFDPARNELRFTAVLPAFPGNLPAAQYRLETRLSDGAEAVLLSDYQAFDAPFRLDDGRDDCADLEGQPVACLPYADLRSVTIEPTVVDGRPFLDVTLETGGDIPLDRVGDYLLPDLATVVETDAGVLRAVIFDAYPADTPGPWLLRGFMENDARQLEPLTDLPDGLAVTAEASRLVWHLPLGLTSPRTQALWYVGTRVVVPTAGGATARGRLSLNFQTGGPHRDYARDTHFRGPPLAFFPPPGKAGSLPQIFYPLMPNFDLPVHLYGVIPFAAGAAAIVRAGCGVVVPAGPGGAVWGYRGDCGQEAEFISGDDQSFGQDQPDAERNAPTLPAAPQPASDAPPPAQQAPRETAPPATPTITPSPSQAPTLTTTPSEVAVVASAVPAVEIIEATRTPSPEDQLQDALASRNFIWLALAGLIVLAVIVIFIIWRSVRRGHPIPNVGLRPPAEVPGAPPVLAPPVLCPVMEIEGSFEPSQGAWQDDYDWADRPTKQLTRESATSWHAELKMVKGRDALLFGIRDTEHNTIVFRGKTTGTQIVDVVPVFTLYENGAAPRVIWRDTQTRQVRLGGPCGLPHDFLVEVDTQRGQPVFSAPFTFNQTGPYRIEGELQLPNGTPTGIKVTVRGEVIETHGLLVAFVPVLLSGATSEEQSALVKFTDDLAFNSSYEIPDFFPLKIGDLRTITSPLQDLSLIMKPAALAEWLENLGVPTPPNLLEAARIGLIVAEITKRLGSTALLAQADRVMVVLRTADYDLTEHPWHPSGAIAASQKVMITRDIAETYTVAHELVHTMPYVYSDDEMRALCGRSYHNAKGGPEANGPRIRTYGLEARTRLRSAASVMNYRSVGWPPVWINQITYWHLLTQLQALPDPPVILVQGTLARIEGQVAGRLGIAYQMDSRVDLQPGAGGDWAILLRDAGGAELGRYPFTPVWWLPDAEVERSVIGFTYRVADVPGVAAIELVGPGGVLDRRVYSAHAPTVRILAPVEGASVPAGELHVAWEGADEDGDALLYSLFYSADGGATWQIRAVEQSSTTLDLTVAAGSGPHRVRVVASDGARSSEAAVSFAVS